MGVKKMMSYIGRAALFSTHLKQGVVLDPSFYETGPNFGMVELGTNIREENGSIGQGNQMENLSL